MKILFEGDSITDCGRNIERGSQLSIGQGYAMIVTSKLGAENPGKYEFINEGISGSRIVDMYARIKKSCLNHNPDIISVLVGINDVGHEFWQGNGVETERYAKVYSMYIEDTLKKLPDVKMILLEPFVSRGIGTENDWDAYLMDTKEKANAVKEIAAEYDQIFVPLQEKFDEAEKLCPQPYWVSDGIHPTPFGHKIIADAWLDAFNKYIK